MTSSDHDANIMVLVMGERFASEMQQVVDKHQKVLQMKIYKQRIRLVLSHVEQNY